MLYCKYKYIFRQLYSFLNTKYRNCEIVCFIRTYDFEIYNELVWFESIFSLSWINEFTNKI